MISLSYSKFLQTTIAALLLATLDHCDGAHKIVRLPDATVEYLSGKHIALLIIAIVIHYLALFTNVSFSSGSGFLPTETKPFLSRLTPSN